MDKCERRTLQTNRGVIDWNVTRPLVWLLLPEINVESSLHVHPLSPWCQEDGVDPMIGTGCVWNIIRSRFYSSGRLNHTPNIKSWEYPLEFKHIDNKGPTPFYQLRYFYGQFISSYNQRHVTHLWLSKLTNVLVLYVSLARRLWHRLQHFLFQRR